ncbi:MFS general substrate transporter [Apiospora arundinis]
MLLRMDFLVGLLSLATLSVALQVSPNSTCAALCLDTPEGNPLDPKASNTNYTDISCFDDEYSSSAKGLKFKNCVECLRDSKDVGGGENDISWFLYNIRYAVDVCMFSFPGTTRNISSPCDINYACAPLQKSLISGNLDPVNGAQYDYCSADGGNFMGKSLNSCVQCLQSSTNQVYTSNFLIALRAGCKQKPQPGHLLGLTGSLFSTQAVNITDPPPAVEDTSKDNTSPMTTGAIVGIAVGAALLFLGGAALFIVYHQKQKKIPSTTRAAAPRPSSPPVYGGFNGVGDHKKINSQNSSSMAAYSDYELRAQQAYYGGKGIGSNAEYYDKIEEEMQMRHQNYSFDPNKPGSGPTGALPTHPAYIPRAMSRASGRGSSSSPQPPSQLSQVQVPQPTAAKSNKPDSYALQAYLNAAEDAATIKIPPPPPRGPPLIIRHALPTPTTAAPPPPAKPKVPSLILPSVPRIRVPKKYAPPKINIQEATPIIGPNDDDGDGNISRPMASHDHGRFPEMGARSTPSPDARSDAPLIDPAPVKQTVVMDGRRRFHYEEVEIHTGKSTLYG